MTVTVDVRLVQHIPRIAHETRRILKMTGAVQLHRFPVPVSPEEQLQRHHFTRAPGTRHYI
jgi:hypothetical protein